MITEALRQLKIACILLLICTLLTGLIYPLVVTGIAQLFFPWQANGSFVKEKGKVVGSALIGQFFDSPGYFWGRPSSTTPFPYNAANSSGSNLGPSNPALFAIIKERMAHFKKFDPNATTPIPIDLVTASASGLDPEISPLAALYQVPRIAKARHVSKNTIEKLITQLTKKRTFGVLGEPRVAILELNMALDKLGETHDRATT